MGVLPTVGVQQVVEQLPLVAQQTALPAGPGALPVSPAPQGVQDVVEITRTARLEPVKEFPEPEERMEAPDSYDRQSLSRKGGDRRKSRRRSLDKRA